jgi:hypothetical protein
MYQFDMTDEQVKLARAAGKLATRHLNAIKLYEGISIGESLLTGRAAAMKAAKTNQPRGKQYALAFAEWKSAFKFPPGKDAERFYDEAIVCAQHRQIAETIISALDVKQKASLGEFGLAKRVRTKLAEFDGTPAKKPRKPRAAREDEFDGRLRDVEERQRSEEPLSYWETDPDAIGRVMARRNRASARRLAAAIVAALDDGDRDNNGDDNDNDGEG